MLTQRLGSNTQKDPAYIEEFIAAVTAHPGCCDEVWLATDYGFPKLETHRKAAEILSMQAEKLRSAGLRVSLQLSNSIGHGEYMSAQDCTGLVYDGSPVEHMVGHDGTVAGYAFCWNGKHFREYTIAALREYVKKIRPYAVWVDDDLRPMNHAPVSWGCYCDGCMAKFNALHGSDFTRETLIQAVTDDPQWRARHMQFLRDGIADFTMEMGRMIHEEAPECRMSYQHGFHGGYVGNNTKYIMEAMYRSTGHEPGSRPGGGSYNDHDPSTFVSKLEDLDAQNRMEPDYVTDLRPEIESLPDVVFGKSIGGTCFETSYYLAGGNNAMSYAMLMNDYEPMEWHGKMFAAFADHRKYWEKLRAGTFGTKPAGWALVLPDEGKPDAGGGFFEGYTTQHYTVARDLRFDGFSITMKPDAAPEEVRLLHAANAAQLSDSEIARLLTVPVITDGRAIRVLLDRGVKLPVDVQEISVAKYMERFTDHPVNRDQYSRIWGGQWGKSTDWELIPTDAEKVEALSEYIHVVPADTPEEECIPVGNAGIKKYKTTGKCASAIITLPSGGKWAVFGFDFWGRIKSAAKRDQYLEASAYISGHRQPAEIVTPLKALLQSRCDGEGRLTQASITNATAGDSGELVLLVTKPASDKVTYMGQYMPETKLQLEKTDTPDVYTVTVPNVKAWSVNTVFFR